MTRSRYTGKQYGVQNGKYQDLGNKTQLESGHLVIDGNQSRARKQHPLDKYLAEELINAQQHQAGICLMRDYAIGHEYHSILSSLGEMRGLSLHGNIDKLTAKDRYQKAVRKLSRLSRLLSWYILIQAEPISSVRELMGFFSERNSGMDRVREMLDDLDEIYYNFKSAEREREKYERV